MKIFVSSGWFHDEKDVLTEALHPFIETYKPELIEKFLKEDIEWGLRGREKIPILEIGDKNDERI